MNNLNEKKRNGIVVVATKKYENILFFHFDNNHHRLLREKIRDSEGCCCSLLRRFVRSIVRSITVASFRQNCMVPSSQLGSENQTNEKKCGSNGRLKTKKADETKQKQNKTKTSSRFLAQIKFRSCLRRGHTLSCAHSYCKIPLESVFVPVFEALLKHKEQNRLNLK